MDAQMCADFHLMEDRVVDLSVNIISTVQPCSAVNCATAVVAAMAIDSVHSTNVSRFVSNVPNSHRQATPLPTRIKVLSFNSFHSHLI